MKPSYELRPFDDQGVQMPSVILDDLTEGAAKGRAGRIAKRNNGPVDIAVAGTADWDKRYLTTVQPSEFHARGYAFKRLD